jgi:DNA recombination protein RmuC
MTENILVIISTIIIGASTGAAVVWFLLSRKKKEPEKDQSFLLMQQQLDQIRETLDSKMSEFRREMGDSNKDIQSAVRTQFSESQKLIQDINKQMTEQLMGVTKGVTEVTESSRQFLNVADQLKDLEKTLKHQKQRGNWGEASLKLALENFLSPNDFQMQHQFSDGEVVDAIIKTHEGIIPVDAKFSLDNYQRYINAEDDTTKAVLEREFKADLKKRIDETAKYIREKEGTLPFAIMYIPAEGIYYDLLVNEIGTANSRKLIDYAYKEKKVVIASPTTFLAYLQTILHGFRAFKFQQNIQEIERNVLTLEKHIKGYAESFVSVGKSLNATVNHYDKAQTQFNLMDKDVRRISGSDGGYEKLEIERPKLGEGV